MDKIKFFFENLGRNIKRFFHKLYVNSYGMDNLNKFLIIGSLVIAILNGIFKSTILTVLNDIFLLAFVFRFFSPNKVKRVEENKLFLKYKNYLKLKWQYRKTHHIFLCKKCKQTIRIPKGHGNVEVTCPNCGTKIDKRS